MRGPTSQTAVFPIPVEEEWTIPHHKIDGVFEASETVDLQDDRVHFEHVLNICDHAFEIIGFRKVVGQGYGLFVPFDLASGDYKQVFKFDVRPRQVSSKGNCNPSVFYASEGELELTSAKGQRSDCEVACTFPQGLAGVTGSWNRVAHNIRPSRPCTQRKCQYQSLHFNPLPPILATLRGFASGGQRGRAA